MSDEILTKEEILQALTPGMRVHQDLDEAIKLHLGDASNETDKHHFIMTLA